MRRPGSLLLVGLVLGCAPAGPQPKSAATTPAAAPAAARVTQLCSESRLTAHGHVCMHPISEEEQRHRSLSIRLEQENGVTVRLLRLNGRGFPEPDDEGCVEYRYRFEAGHVSESTGYRPDGVVCDHTLYSERMTRSRHVDAWGRPSFDRERLFTQTITERDERGFSVKQRGLASDGSPTSIAGVHELRWERDATGWENRVCYFDAKGKPMHNDYGVHCWAFQRDKYGTELQQDALDVEGKPVATPQGTHSIVKEVDAYGNVMSRKLLGLSGQPISSEPDACPVLRYLRDENGFALGADCLDAEGKPARFDDGNSMWRATPNPRGRPREYRYFDVDGNPYAPELGYARQEIVYDDLGHAIERRYFQADGSPGSEKSAPVVRYGFDAEQLEVQRSNFDSDGNPWRYKGCVSITTQYDQYRQAVRQACLDEDGKPALSSENVSTTLWRYDARGLLAETRYLGKRGEPIDARSGYARKVYGYDVYGADSHAHHYRADGSELQLPRFAGVWVRPPHADEFWPARSRQRAFETIEAARSAIVGGMPLVAVLSRFSSGRVNAVNAGDLGYVNYDHVWPALRAALEPLKVGEVSPVVEIPYGLVVYRRTE